jgi:EAL domain-containing protein (putative c-di-GMP-specific phosphodiesterase class I)
MRPEMAHLTLAVNVSAHQFRQTDFVEQVLAISGNTGVDPAAEAGADRKHAGA